MAADYNISPGEARCQAESVQDLLDLELRPVPATLREQNYTHHGSQPYSASHYFDPEYHRKEVEAVWRHTWQMVCLEQDIPNPGDSIVYEISRFSMIITRTSRHEIKALQNSCLHRGRRLLDEDKTVSAFVCPYHKFTWGLDGTFKSMPCPWDFPHINKKNFDLPQARVATWQGFVFINLDPDAPSFEAYIGPMASYCDRYEFPKKWKCVHLGKVMNGNWKISMEAFMESFHVIATHPQAMASTADCNSQYDNWDGHHFSRLYTALARPSPHLARDVSEQEIASEMLGEETRLFEAVREGVRVPDGMTARHFIAQQNRDNIRESTGVDLSDMTDSEMVDAIQYYLFPNFFPWAAPNPNIVYRFRPHGDDPEKSLMEVMLLVYPTKGQPMPPAAKMRLLGDDEPWTSAADEIGGLGLVFHQDQGNIEAVQRGAKASLTGEIYTSEYQEIRVRDVHWMIDRYIAKYAC